MDSINLNFSFKGNVQSKLFGILYTDISAAFFKCFSQIQNSFLHVTV